MTTPVIDLICSYQICAAHRLFRADWTPAQNKEVFGKCAAIHGHEYTLELTLTGPIHEDSGMLMNASRVDQIVKPFLEKSFDHKFLNQDEVFFKDRLPTAEWIAVWLYESLKDQFSPPVALKKVRVFETRDLAVEFPTTASSLGLP